MKKIKLLFIFSGLFLLCYSPFSVFADSDGSLQLHTDMITTQSGVVSSTSDFAIRSQLFSKDLDSKMKENAKKSEEATQHIGEIDFNKVSQNKLYKANYQSIKTKLFIDYSQTNITSSDSDKTSQNNGIFLFLILAIPLMILTGFVSRNLTRRKRRK